MTFFSWIHSLVDTFLKNFFIKTSVSKGQNKNSFPDTKAWPSFDSQLGYMYEMMRFYEKRFERACEDDHLMSQHQKVDEQAVRLYFILFGVFNIIYSAWLLKNIEL